MNSLPQHSKAQGYSTGWDPATRSDYAAAVADCCPEGVQAIELSALHLDNLPVLSSYLVGKPLVLSSLEYVSVHAPAKPNPLPWEDFVAGLENLPVEIDSIVVHPDTVTDPHTLVGLGSRLVFENMDVRKAGFHTARQMEEIFWDLPQAGFCLDVAHTWGVDQSLQQGHEMLDELGSLLTQVHVSGIELNGHHRPTTAADLKRYWPLLERCTHVPWIFEAPYVG